jgi:DNA-binding transcriptional ArsR family regulator
VPGPEPRDRAGRPPAAGSPAERRGGTGDVVISDPRAIRALAHPARLAVLDALAGGEELTATECAELADLSPSAMSYHLRALEKWGLVERAPATADGRERPWRSRGRGFRIESTAPSATMAVETALVDTVMDIDRQAISDFIARQDREPPEWDEAMSVGRTTVWLTADEAREVNTTIAELLDRYRGRRERAARPEGARRVRVSHQVVPIDEPPLAPPTHTPAPARRPRRP